MLELPQSNQANNEREKTCFHVLLVYYISLYFGFMFELCLICFVRSDIINDMSIIMYE